MRAAIAAAIAFAIACGAGAYAYLDARVAAQGPRHGAAARTPHAEAPGHPTPAVSGAS